MKVYVIKWFRTKVSFQMNLVVMIASWARYCVARIGGWLYTVHNYPGQMNGNRRWPFKVSVAINRPRNSIWPAISRIRTNKLACISHNSL